MIQVWCVHTVLQECAVRAMVLNMHSLYCLTRQRLGLTSWRNPKGCSLDGCLFRRIRDTHCHVFQLHATDFSDAESWLVPGALWDPVLLLVQTDELVHVGLLPSVIGVLYELILRASEGGANLILLLRLSLVVYALLTDVLFPDAATASTIPYPPNVLI